MASVTDDVQAQTSRSDPAPASAAGDETRVSVGVSTAFREVLDVAIVVRIVFILVALAATYFLASGTGAQVPGFSEVWRRWDAAHLLDIADAGYFAETSDKNAAAFFPLYPLAVRPLLQIGIPQVLAGMIVSALACVVAFMYLFRMAEEEYGAGAGRRAVLYLALFPTAVFLVAPYSESLFLAGAIAAFYYPRRHEWNMVGICAAVAMASRFAGVFLIAGLAVEFIRQRQFSWQRIKDAIDRARHWTATSRSSTRSTSIARREMRSSTSRRRAAGGGGH